MPFWLGPINNIIKKLTQKEYWMNNPTKKIDFVAFSELRPGVPYSDCKDILLSHWRSLKAPDEGKITLFKFGCSVSVDINGIISKVSYFGRFPEKRVIEGLRRGMALHEVQNIFTELVEIENDEDGWRDFTQNLESGYLLTLNFCKDVLAGINIENPQAIYPKKEDFNFGQYYPTPLSEGDSLFIDGNFKLAVLSELLSRGLIDLAKPEDLASYALGRYIDFGEDEDDEVTGYDSIPECLDYLLHYPLTEELLAQVETVYFDGGLEIYRYICYYWDGESDEFDITSLRDGILLEE